MICLSNRPTSRTRRWAIGPVLFGVLCLAGCLADSPTRPRSADESSTGSSRGGEEHSAVGGNRPSTDGPERPTSPEDPASSEPASPAANAEASSDQSVSARLTANAVQLIKAGQTEMALEQLQQAILIDQDNLEAIFRVMSILDDRGLQKIQAGDASGGYADLRVAGIFARRIVARGMLEGLPDKQRGWVANALYNEACARCFAGEQELALASLAMALETGFDHPELIESDPDLQGIRQTPGFAQLVKTYVHPDHAHPDHAR